MPGFGTTARTRSNAERWPALGAHAARIPIARAVRRHFRDIGHDETLHDVTYENAQARERTQILMDWPTGRRPRRRHRRPLGAGPGLDDLQRRPHVDVRRQRRRAQDAGALPGRLVRREPSSAARRRDGAARHPGHADHAGAAAAGHGRGRWQQKTEDTIGPYELHDFFLYHTCPLWFRAGARSSSWRGQAFAGEYDAATILQLAGGRSTGASSASSSSAPAMPDGPKVGTVALSPRGDWRMPSDASPALWLAEVDEIGRWLAGIG